MALVVADTSALVSLGVVADHDTSPLTLLLEDHRIVIPEQVLAELRETASYEDGSGNAARAVLDRRSTFDVRTTELDEAFPLDDGENAAVTLANDLHASQLLCDEFNRLALVHASLADTRLVTTPTQLSAMVRNGRLEPSDAEEFLSRMSAVRSWSGNAYVERVRAALQAMDG